MKISTKSEYGTLAMLDLAINYQNGYVQMREIAERQDITFKYLGQLFLLLKNRGLIKGLRGASGGYRLSRPPEKITLLEIFESLEGPLSITNCTTNKDCCVKSKACVTREIWKETRDLIYNFYKKVTLEDLVSKYNKKKLTPNCEEKNESYLS